MHFFPTFHSFTSVIQLKYPKNEPMFARSILTSLVDVSARLFVCVYRFFFPQLKASLAEQLSVEQLRTEFRRYIKTRVAQELIDFYLDSLDREEVMGFFERQVANCCWC